MAEAVGRGLGDLGIVSLEQSDLDTADPLFLSILDTVVVLILPDIVADGGELDKAGIKAEVVFPRREAECRGAIGNGIRIAVDGIITTGVGSGEDGAVGQSETNGIAASNQLCEEIVAGGVSGIGGHCSALRIIESDDDAGHAGLAGILETVLIEVVPDQIAGAGGLEDARIRGADVVAAGEGESTGAAGDTVGIAVRGIIAGIGRAEDKACGQQEADLIGSGQKVVEEIEAVGLGAGAANKSIGTIVDQHGDTGDAGLAGILDAVAVDIDPDAVADRGGLEDASIEIKAILANSEGHLLGFPCREVGITVGGVIAALIDQGEFKIGRGDELNLIGARLEVGEVIEAVVIGGSCCDLDAGVVEQTHRYTQDTGFAALLDAIMIAVIPDIIAQCGEGVETTIRAEIGFVGRKRIGGALAGGGIDIAVGTVISALVHGRESIALRLGDADAVVAGGKVVE